MDFSTLTGSEAHEQGSWLHLPHPASGLPLYLAKGNSITTEETDKPCRVLVRGNRAPQVKRVLDDRARNDELHAMRVMRSSERDAQQLAADNAKAREAHQRALLVASVADWENIVLTEGEKPAECTQQNILAALSHPAFMVAIFKRSADEAALFQDAPTG